MSVEKAMSLHIDAATLQVRKDWFQTAIAERWGGVRPATHHILGGMRYYQPNRCNLNPSHILLQRSLATLHIPRLAASDSYGRLAVL